MVIAIDFDGTITQENKFPEIGEVRPFAIEAIKDFQRHGHQCFLWTCRENQYLEDAKNFLESEGLYMDGYNTSPYDYINAGCRKPIADLYIDDRCVFCNGIDWQWLHKTILAKDESVIKEKEGW